MNVSKPRPSSVDNNPSSADLQCRRKANQTEGSKVMGGELNYSHGAQRGAKIAPFEKLPLQYI